MLIKNTSRVIGLAVLLASASTTYAASNFACPSPEEIQSTDFTAPSIWVAPPVVHSQPGQVGVGFGGKKVKRLLGVENTLVGGHDGWVCVYKSEGGTSVHDYQNKIRKIVVGNKFLIKYIEKVNKAFDDAEPFLKHYPQDESIGFVGYQIEHSQQQQPQQPQQQKK